MQLQLLIVNFSFLSKTHKTDCPLTVENTCGTSETLYAGKTYSWSRHQIIKKIFLRFLVVTKEVTMFSTCGNSWKS